MRRWGVFHNGLYLSTAHTHTHTEAKTQNWAEDTPTPVSVDS